jgi:hypothetical protein
MYVDCLVVCEWDRGILGGITVTLLLIFMIRSKNIDVVLKFKLFSTSDALLSTPLPIFFLSFSSVFTVISIVIITRSRRQPEAT